MTSYNMGRTDVTVVARLRTGRTSRFDSKHGRFFSSSPYQVVSGAHRSSCPMVNEWSVANHTALHRSRVEGSKRLEFRFHHPPICNCCHWNAAPIRAAC